MMIQFQNLNEMESAELYDFEDSYAEYVTVSETSAAFNGKLLLRMTISHISSFDPQVKAAIIGGIAAIIAAIVARIPVEVPQEPVASPPTVIIVLKGGHELNVNSFEELSSETIKALLEEISNDE